MTLTTLFSGNKSKNSVPMPAKMHLWKNGNSLGLTKVSGNYHKVSAGTKTGNTLTACL